MTRPNRHHLGDRLTHPHASREQIACDFALGPLDTATRAADLKWGVDRLPELFPPETATRYGLARADLNAAIEAQDVSATTAAAERLIRALEAMDKAATAAGCKTASPTVWQFSAAGVRYGLIRDPAEWPAAQAAEPHLAIISLPEVAAMIEARIAAIPPVTTEQQRRQPTRTEIALDDEIPF